MCDRTGTAQDHSDEIHCDIVKAGHTHHMLESGRGSGLIITCVAPTKTFNIAGLECSHIIIHDATIRQRWKNSSSISQHQRTELFCDQCRQGRLRQR
ncbi:MAG: hypothetical protein ACLVJ6_13425 [Merdibacter sp.]